MPFSCIACAVVSLVDTYYNHPWNACTVTLLAHMLVYWARSTIINGMRLRWHHLPMCQSIGYGLQSLTGCVYGGITCAFVSLLGADYNHPWDLSTATPLAHVSVHWVRSTIINVMRLRRHHSRMCQSIGYCWN